MTFVSPQLERGLNVLNECLNFEIAWYTHAHAPISKSQKQLQFAMKFNGNNCVFVFERYYVNQRIISNQAKQATVGTIHTAMFNQWIETIILINLASVEIDRFDIADSCIRGLDCI